jgi:uncharacterized protein (DUF885 family)
MPFAPRFLALLLCPLALATQPTWVAQSNDLAQSVLSVAAQFNPEFGSNLGLEAFDTQIVDHKADVYERKLSALTGQLEKLRTQRAAEQDLHVQQDIDIMIDTMSKMIDSAKLNHKVMLEYVNVSQDIFDGMHTLLDARNKPARQALAVTRLKRYVGMEKGYTPVTELAQAEQTQALARPGLVGPYVEDVKQQLDNSEAYLKGIREMLIKDKVTGWEGAYDKLVKQVHAYNDWTRANLLPRTRHEARPPAEIYADNLKQMGVEISPDELIARASADYLEVRDQIQQVATQLATAQHLPSSDYRDVIRHYKETQIAPEALLPLYWKRLREIEAIIRREHLISLPNRDANIRIATDAEAAQSPAPQMQSPRLIGNTGEYGEFIIPLTNPHAKSGARFDDFTNDPVTWTLAAHEARPGHELQFASMIERGTSLPRVLFAYNSANVEGWAVYCEAMMLPYMPPEGQLFSLQERLQRVARAFLDPMVNLGRITPAEAKQFLMDEVALSEPMSQQEVDRYAFVEPGQATSYYYGYMNMRGLRLQAEIALGARFNLQAFNDFVIAQGLLPPTLLKQAVLKEFIPAQLAGQKSLARN